jgi:hypothetical protein
LNGIATAPGVILCPNTYSLDDVAILDDPFDISVGMVDLKPLPLAELDI